MKVLFDNANLESTSGPNSFANKLIGGHASATTIPDDAIKLGLYWQSFGEQRKDFVVTTTGEETSFFSIIYK